MLLYQQHVHTWLPCICIASSSPYVEIWSLGNERKPSKGNHWYSVRVIIQYVCIIYHHRSHLILKQRDEEGRANIIISNIRIWILMIYSKEKEECAYFFFFPALWFKKDRKIVLNDYLYVYTQIAFLNQCVSTCKMLREDLITTVGHQFIQQILTEYWAICWVSIAFQLLF